MQFNSRQHFFQLTTKLFCRKKINFNLTKSYYLWFDLPKSVFQGHWGHWSQFFGLGVFCFGVFVPGVGCPIPETIFKFLRNEPSWFIPILDETVQNFVYMPLQKHELFFLELVLPPCDLCTCFRQNVFTVNFICEFPWRDCDKFPKILKWLQPNAFVSLP